MSIRFRLTLLYSTILALTLIIFGVALYSIQAKDTINSLKLDLQVSSEKFPKQFSGMTANTRHGIIRITRFQPTASF